MDYEEIKEQVKKDIKLKEKKILDWLMHIPRNPRGLGILEQATIDGKPFSSTLLSKAPKQLATEDFDTERAKTDFIYFAIHCLTDARTGKPFQWSSAQIELMRKFVEYKKQKQKTLSK